MIKKPVDPWYMVINQEYEPAEQFYLQNYEETKEPRYLFQYGQIKIIKNEIPEAIQFIERSINETDAKYLGSTSFLLLSVCYWIIGDFDKVVSNLEKSFHTPYTDAAGGVEPPAMLLYVGVRLHDKKVIDVARKKLTHFWKLHIQRQKRRLVKKEYSEEDFIHPGLFAWPGMIVPYLLGLIDEKVALKVIEKKYKGSLRSRYTCQFNFYRGLVGLMNGDNEQFKEGMLKCANSNNGLLEQEYFLARWERDNNFPIVNWTSK